MVCGCAGRYDDRMNRHQVRPLILFLAGLGMFPTAWLMYVRGDPMGVAMALVAGVVVSGFSVWRYFSEAERS
jgi:hypothetical protein